MNRHTLIILFDALVIFAIVLVASSLFTAILSKSIKRSMSWYNVMFQWLVITLIFMLLFGQQEGPEPPFAFCTFQALLMYAVPVMGGMGIICHFLEFHLIIYSCTRGETLFPNRWRTFWLVTSPWIAGIAIIVINSLLLFPGGHILDVERASTGYYCHAKDALPTILSAAVCAAVLLVGIALQVWTGVLIYRYWDAFETLRKNSRRIFVTIYVRMVLCVLVSATGLILAALALYETWSDDTSLFYPCSAWCASFFEGLIDEERLVLVLIGIAIAHGTQKSIFRAWLFWRTPKPYNSIIFTDGTVSNGNNASIEDDEILIIGPNVEDINLEGNEAKDRLKGVYWAE